MTRAELIAALEAATGPSRELDEKISLCIGEWRCFLSKHRYWSFSAKDRNFAFPNQSIPLYDQDTGQRIDLTDEPWSGWADDGNVPAYTSSIDAALTLVPNVLGIMWDVAKYPGEEAAAYVGQHSNPCREFVIAKTPAIALCIAALKVGEGKDD